jgi:carboxylesterase type B
VRSVIAALLFCAAALKPVMVWIPGGGNFAGGSSNPRMEGEQLARHDVVVSKLS